MTAPCIDRPKTLCYPTAAHRLLLPPVNLKAANDKTHVGHRTGHRTPTNLLPFPALVLSIAALGVTLDMRAPMGSHVATAYVGALA